MIGASRLEYPWLATTTTVEDYVDPAYYGRLLKPYAFDGRTDLELFDSFIKSRQPVDSALELGSGSGRVTEIFVAAHPHTALTLVDLSTRMLNATRIRFANPRGTSFVNSDALDFLGATDSTYDLVFSLWSFSHSVHQWVHRIGAPAAGRKVDRALRKLAVQNLNPGGAFFLIHFDSLSDEQRLLMPQWRRVYSAFADVATQSPSKRIIDSTLRRLDDEGVIRFSSTHLLGDPIIYRDEANMLEVMVNFHLESYFNDRPERDDVIQDLRDRAAPFRRDDGAYEIRPGAYVFSFERV